MRSGKAGWRNRIAAAVAVGLGMTGGVWAQEEAFPSPPPPAESPPTAEAPAPAPAPPPEAAKPSTPTKPGIGELRLGFLPFFSAGQALPEESEEIFGKWLETVVEKQLEREGLRTVDATWLKAKKVDGGVFAGLPSSRPRQAAELLGPVAKDFQVDGVLATWAQSREAVYELVLLLYLPNRIQYEQFTVAANFERATLERTERGSFAAAPTQAVMRDLLDRNLRRILPPVASHAPPEASPAEAGAGEPKPSAPAVEAETAPGGGSGGSSTVAVLDFSRDFRADSAAVSSLTTDPRSFDFRAAAHRWLERAVGSRRWVNAADPEAASFNQIEAPVLDLDPDADPHAREKALFAQVGSGVDALILGHVREDGKKKVLISRFTSACCDAVTSSIS